VTPEVLPFAPDQLPLSQHRAFSLTHAQETQSTPLHSTLLIHDALHSAMVDAGLC